MTNTKLYTDEEITMFEDIENNQYTSIFPKELTEQKKVFKAIANNTIEQKMKKKGRCEENIRFF